MRIGVLTSIETRHRYFVQAVRTAFDLAAVGYEETGYSPAAVDPANLAPEESAIVAEHFAERKRREVAFFGANSAFILDGEPCPSVSLKPGQLNSEETAAFFEEAAVDVLLIYGTNLIREPLLSRFAGRMINMHLGLSPYYRGTATNFYPLLNEEPEYVGATIHLIDPGIDSGPILAHARPVIEPGDGPHVIGCKAIQAGIDKLIEVLPQWHAGEREPVPQWEVTDAKLYLRKDYHPRQVVELYKKLERGLIDDYLARAHRTAGLMRLVD
jgi:hypothetical protein